jgi:hypothetical protein
MVSRNQAYELESLLLDIQEEGYIRVNKYKLWRLLGKGSNAAGTWKALLDAWEELGENFRRSELRILELPSENFLITKTAIDRVTTWAGESN